jgi:hypothetical protein
MNSLDSTDPNSASKTAIYGLAKDVEGFAKSSICKSHRFLVLDRKNLQELDRKLQELAKALQNPENKLTEQDIQKVIDAYKTVHSTVLESSRKSFLLQQIQRIYNRTLLQSIQKSSQLVETTIQRQMRSLLADIEPTANKSPVQNNVIAFTKDVQTAVEKYNRFLPSQKKNLESLRVALEVLKAELENPTRPLTDDEKKQAILACQAVYTHVLEVNFHVPITQKMQHRFNKEAIASLHEITNNILETLAKQPSAKIDRSSISTEEDSVDCPFEESAEKLTDMVKPPISSSITEQDKTTEEILKHITEAGNEELGIPEAFGMYDLFLHMLGNQKLIASPLIQSRYREVKTTIALGEKPVPKESVVALLKALGFSAFVSQIASLVCTNIKIQFPEVFAVEKCLYEGSSIVFPEPKQAIVFKNVPDPSSLTFKKLMPSVQNINVGIHQIFYKNGNIYVQFKHFDETTNKWKEPWRTENLGSVTGAALDFWKAIHEQSKK